MLYFFGVLFLSFSFSVDAQTREQEAESSARELLIDRLPHDFERLLQSPSLDALNFGAANPEHNRFRLDHLQFRVAWTVLTNPEAVSSLFFDEETAHDFARRLYHWVRAQSERRRDLGYFPISRNDQLVFVRESLLLPVAAQLSSSSDMGTQRLIAKALIVERLGGYHFRSDEGFEGFRRWNQDFAYYFERLLGDAEFLDQYLQLEVAIARENMEARFRPQRVREIARSPRAFGSYEWPRIFAEPLLRRGSGPEGFIGDSAFESTGAEPSTLKLQALLGEKFSDFFNAVELQLTGQKPGPKDEKELEELLSKLKLLSFLAPNQNHYFSLLKIVMLLEKAPNSWHESFEATDEDEEIFLEDDPLWIRLLIRMARPIANRFDPPTPPADEAWQEVRAVAWKILASAPEQRYADQIFSWYPQLGVYPVPPTRRTCSGGHGPCYDDYQGSFTSYALNLAGQALAHAHYQFPKAAIEYLLKRQEDLKSVTEKPFGRTEREPRDLVWAFLQVGRLRDEGRLPKLEEEVTLRLGEAIDSARIQEETRLCKEAMLLSGRR